MTSNTVAGLYARLGFDQSHSRPHVSNDNPYSEANFKTLKYCRIPREFGIHSKTSTYSAATSSGITTMNTGTPV